MPVILVRRHPPVGLMLIGLLALGVRLAYILVVARAPVGVGGDAGFYHSAANLIAHGHFFYRGIFGHPHATAEHPPLFSLVLAAVSLFGGDSLLAHRVAGCVIGSLAVVLISLLARRVAGARSGWIAGVLAALYPPLITADGLVMSEPLFVLGVAGALLLAIRLRAEKGGGARGAALLGLVLGLCTLTRGEGLLLLPLLGWPVALAGARGTRWRRGAAVTVAVALTLA
ncbi:MAG: glycosyltransferase family 39 protein, partial [Actinomycetota bacterium]|nr:glycosyltransferase family 39 protein [Actinomycetota bacterium]